MPGADAPEMGIERLVDAYAAGIYSVAFHLTGSTEDAEEVTLVALREAARRIHSFERKFRSWLYGIAARRANEWLRMRRSGGREIVLDDVLPAFDDGGQRFRPIEDWSARLDAVSPLGLRVALPAAIAELSTDDRTAFVLHDVGGLSAPDVAAALGIGLATVRSRVHRSRLFVRKSLSGSRDWGAQAARDSLTARRERGIDYG